MNAIAPVFATTLLAAGISPGVLILGVLVVAGITIGMVVKNLLYVCQPNEVLVFTGRKRSTSNGTLKGYRIIRGGRALRTPLIEKVDRMDLTNMIIEVSVRNAYSKGGIPLTVQGIANLKIPGEEPLLSNSLERFLGRSREEIMKIARETLEGNLRGVLATLTPEQVNQDKESFAEKLTGEAEHDFSRLGLVLDTLKIQNVSDEVGYLDAIGRARSAQIRRDAQVAEAQAKSQAEQQKWLNTTQADLAKLDAAIEIARKDNERRVADATTRRAALIAKERADVQALVAKSKAEIDTQDARIQQVRLQLQADVIQPAEAKRREAEETAKGEAAKVVEQGQATANVLKDLAETYKHGGTAGRDVLLMQKLVPLLEQLSGTLGTLHVDRLTVLGKSGKGDGDGALAGTLINMSEQIKAATGVDVPALVRDKLGGSDPKPPPLANR